MWLICKNRSGTIWKVNNSEDNEIEMFSLNGELFSVVESYSDKTYSFVEVYTIMNKLKNKKEKGFDHKTALLTIFGCLSIFGIFLVMLRFL